MVHLAFFAKIDTHRKLLPPLACDVASEQLQIPARPIRARSLPASHLPAADENPKQIHHSRGNIPSPIRVAQIPSTKVASLKSLFLKRPLCQRRDSVHPVSASNTVKDFEEPDLRGFRMTFGRGATRKGSPFPIYYRTCTLRPSWAMPFSFTAST